METWRILCGKFTEVFCIKTTFMAMWLPGKLTIREGEKDGKILLEEIQK